MDYKQIKSIFNQMIGKQFLYSYQMSIIAYGMDFYQESMLKSSSEGQRRVFNFCLSYQVLRADSLTWLQKLPLQPLLTQIIKEAKVDNWVNLSTYEKNTICQGVRRYRGQIIRDIQALPLAIYTDPWINRDFKLQDFCVLKSKLETL